MFRIEQFSKTLFLENLFKKFKNGFLTKTDNVGFTGIVDTYFKVYLRKRGTQKRFLEFQKQGGREGSLGEFANPRVV